jgi:hypothetical protein
MQLRYREDLTIDAKDRDAFRQLLGAISWQLPDESPFQRLYENDDVPAKEVLADIWRLPLKVERLTDPFDLKAANPEVLKRFTAYVRRRVKLEKVVAMTDRLVAAAVRAGLTYSTSQSMFVRALDRYAEAHPDAFPVEGW